MPLTPVRYRRRDDTFVVAGRGEFSVADDDSLVLPMGILRDASLNDLNQAIRGSGHRTVYFTEAPWDQYDPDLAPRAAADVILPLDDENCVDVSATMYIDDGQEPPLDELRRLVQPLLDRHRARWAGMWTDDDYGPGLVVGVFGSLPARRRSVGELFDLGQELTDLLGAYSGAGELTARSVFNLVRGGRAALVVGQREGPWLDVKEFPYALGTAPQKFEFAKDIASFANTGRDALIVLGLRGGRDRNGEFVESARPFNLNAMNVEATRAVLRDHIVPTILDIEIGVVEAQAGYGYGYIFIPSQPPDVLPYLVAGAITDGTVNGAHVSIPYRAGEDTAYADAARIHSLILAGRAALGN